MTQDETRLLDLSIENDASLWLTTLTLEEEGYHLTKQNFWDLVRFRYGFIGMDLFIYGVIRITSKL